jgi:hypothetical protein
MLMLVAQAPDLPPDWELKTHAARIGPEVARLRPLLEKLDPRRWTAAGAPEAYAKQYRECLDQIGYVQNTATRLSAQPARMTLAVETLVRLESLIQISSSLSQAVRRYQNPAVADLLDAEIAAAGSSRDWLRQHVSDLAAVRERELESAEQEAQRCRTQSLRQGGRK